MNKIIVEVGSTCTKIDQFDGENIKKLEGKTIQFKKHYNEDKELRESDIKELKCAKCGWNKNCKKRLWHCFWI